MRLGTNWRVGRGIYVYRSGGGSAAITLGLGACFALLWVYAFAAFVAVVCALILFTVVQFFLGGYMTSKRLQELQARAIAPGSVRADGSYTVPRTWGVYKVEAFKNGRRGDAFHMGNHPVRQRELEREYGAAELVLLFETRVDAEEMKYLLSKNVVSPAAVGRKP